MNISGIVVQAEPGRLEEVAAALADMAGVAVHYRHPPSQRLVATLEAPATGGEAALLQAVKGLPRVCYAEMVYHHFEDAAPPAPLPPDPDRLSGLDPAATTALAASAPSR